MHRPFAGMPPSPTSCADRRPPSSTILLCWHVNHRSTSDGASCVRCYKIGSGIQFASVETWNLSTKGFLRNFISRHSFVANTIHWTFKLKALLRGLKKRNPCMA
uniref:Uncharacterized protein n=1 Tax=Arundo donax TaxID=35708 RepID=A0A0A8YCX1_ARUDO